MQTSIKLEPIFETKQIGEKEVPIYIVNGKEYTDKAEAEKQEAMITRITEFNAKLDTIQSFRYNEDKHDDPIWFVDSAEKMEILWQHLGLYTKYDNIEIVSNLSNTKFFWKNAAGVSTTPQDLYNAVGNTCWLYEYNDGGDYTSTHSLLDVRDGLADLLKFVDNLKACGLDV